MLVIGESTCQTLLEHNYGSMVIFAVAWGEQSPLSSGMAQKSTHLPEYWPTGDFWSRCPLLAPRWPIMMFQGSEYPLEGVQSPYWRGFQVGRLKKLPEISSRGQNAVFRPNACPYPLPHLLTAQFSPVFWQFYPCLGQGTHVLSKWVHWESFSIIQVVLAQNWPKLRNFGRETVFCISRPEIKKVHFFPTLILISGPSPVCWCVEMCPKWGRPAL